ncbi:MAG: 4Fe-4S binding protein [Pyrinomonadaceae bacterium]|nr:4Fe-4S binding protein [Phycisphaerales bacterium]
MTSLANSGSKRCEHGNSKPASTLSISLPVLATGDSALHNGRTSHRAGKSTIGRWRAAVLILLNLVMVGHIIQWLIHGMTLSPIEPSESMRGLEEGVINTGFVFFFLAILSTLIFGRFFCGWGCHIVSYQDFCSWIMNKLGVRPKPFRSRLMVYIPLGVALYMFVWPTFKRHALTPLLGNEYGRLPNWLGTVPPIDRLTSEFLVKDYWATFPPWYVAIPYFAVVGFAIVYFLGSKGFCTYGCPYGGFFGPADLVSPGKIRVTDACEQCGHCTAVCTSNVRVHEEVRDFGMVVNPGCMKCMDCVNVCPKDALYFGFGKPTVLAKPRSPEAAERQRVKKSSLKQFDLSPRQEWLAVGVFLVLVWGFRSFINEVPLLMAVGMAAIGTFWAWKLWAFARIPNVRIQSVQLKVKGKLRPAGYIFALLGVLYLLAALWGGVVRYALWRADLAYMKVEETGPSVQQILSPGFRASPELAEAANEAVRFHHLASSPLEDDGGFGWGYSNLSLARLAYLTALQGNYAEAEQLTRRLLSRQKPVDSIVLDLTRFMQAQDRSLDEIIAEFRARLADHPELIQTRSELTRALTSQGKGVEAIKEFESAATTLDTTKDLGPLVAPTLRDHAYLQLALGNRARGADLLKQAVARGEDNAEVLVSCAAAFMQLENTPEALKALDQAKLAVTQSEHDVSPFVLLNIARGYAAAGKREAALDMVRQVASMKDQPHAMLQAAGLLGELSSIPDAVTVVEDAASAAARKTRRHLGNFHRPQAASTHIAAGSLLYQAGRIPRAIELITAGVELAPTLPSVLTQAASVYLSAQDAARAIPLLEKAVTLQPADASMNHDLAVAYMLANRPKDAAASMTRAAELEPTNAEFAERAAQIYQQMGNAELARKWQAEAATRGQRK